MAITQAGDEKAWSHGFVGRRVNPSKIHTSVGALPYSCLHKIGKRSGGDPVANWHDPLRSELGAALRAAREAAGLKQVQLGQAIGCGQGKINKIESAASVVKSVDVFKIIDATGASPETRDVILDLFARMDKARPEVSEGYPEYFRKFASSELLATRIRSVHCTGIPGELQSEHFMTTQIRLWSPENVAKRTESRRARQELLEYGTDVYEFIIGEEILRRISGRVGGAAALDQLEHLAKLAGEKSVNLRVLTFEAKVTVQTDYTIVNLPSGHPDFVYIELRDNGLYLEKSAELAGYEDSWAEVCDDALSVAESAEFLARMTGELEAIFIF